CPCRLHTIIILHLLTKYCYITFQRQQVTVFAICFHYIYIHIGGQLRTAEITIPSALFVIYRNISFFKHELSPPVVYPECFQGSDARTAYHKYIIHTIAIWRKGVGDEYLA